ncbi:MAG: hypothetical protein KJ887_00885 [Candidatus Omnitrophica bacterium]|nr:hypothetical protein [Candidatus Omnitrophota bacterium]MBU1048111.1 hypothetical protein [Candidatus Omnitrophota bacterium]MBU1630755.1 hypothetical protein [Candidatus Omnitrophota bacterium]MBU1766981.1 hypothetical protein [Candidatus Omnitrophota bacterium]MBU1889201.1 hypothetical protein [Candidatus Omnitrophota bacterium]
MFKDYSFEIEQIKESLSSIKDKIDKIEKLIVGTSDDINFVKSHFGLEHNFRKGKRTKYDITRLIHWILLKNKDIKDEQVFNQIIDFIATMDDKKFNFTLHNDDKNKKAKEEYNIWRDEIKNEWLEEIKWVREEIEADKVGNK